MKYDIHSVVNATVVALASLKLEQPDYYTSNEWSAIADAMETLIAIAETADAENEEDEERVTKLFKMGEPQ